MDMAAVKVEASAEEGAGDADQEMSNEVEFTREMKRAPMASKRGQ